jgi:hypothetical protein
MKLNLELSIKEKKVLYFILRSKKRIEVFNYIINKDIFLSRELSKFFKFRSNLSRILKDFEKLNLINCLNKYEYNYKIYTTTNLSNKISKEFKYIKN